MTRTELTLTAVHGGPVARLDAVCSKYLNLSYDEARRRAAIGALPFPTFRLGQSAKAPLMVHVKDLAAHIDAAEEKARKDWAPMEGL